MFRAHALLLDYLVCVAHVSLVPIIAIPGTPSNQDGPMVMVPWPGGLIR